MTPTFYNKISPPIKKPILACFIFMVGFLIYSFLIILPYHYGVVVPKKEGVIALSSFIPLFVIYALFTYDSYSIFKFPYFIQKHLIDPRLRTDLERSQSIQVSHAYIIDIQKSSKSIHALLLQSADLTEPEWFYVNLNLMFPKVYFFSDIDLQESCIGQEINIEYLPESKVILKIYATEIETDFSTVDGTSFFCAVPKKLARIPSRFSLDFLHIQHISVQRLANTLDYELICQTADQIYAIPSSRKGFRQLELALGSKINWTVYNQFKNNIKQQHAKISG